MFNDVKSIEIDGIPVSKITINGLLLWERSKGLVTSDGATFMTADNKKFVPLEIS